MKKRLFLSMLEAVNRRKRKNDEVYQISSQTSSLEVIRLDTSRKTNITYYDSEPRVSCLKTIK